MRHLQRPRIVVTFSSALDSSSANLWQGFPRAIFVIIAVFGSSQLFARSVRDPPTVPPSLGVTLSNALHRGTELQTTLSAGNTWYLLIIRLRSFRQRSTASPAAGDAPSTFQRVDGEPPAFRGAFYTDG